MKPVHKILGGIALMAASSMASAGLIATLTHTIGNGTFNGNSVNGETLTIDFTVGDGAVDQHTTGPFSGHNATYLLGDPAVSTAISVTGANGGSFVFNPTGSGNEYFQISDAGNDQINIFFPTAFKWGFDNGEFIPGEGNADGAVDDILALFTTNTFNQISFGYFSGSPVFSDGGSNTLSILTMSGTSSLTVNSDAAAVPISGTLSLAMLGLAGLRIHQRKRLTT